MGANYGFKPFTGTEEEIHTEYLDTYEKYSVTTVAACWGLQRAVGSKFSLEVNLGLSLSYLAYGVRELDKYQKWTLSPATGVRFGYVIK